MYATHPHTGSRARLFGVVSSAVMLVGAGYMFSYGMIQDYIAPPPDPTELVIITPETPQEVLPLPEIKEVKADLPPPPQLTAPPVEFVPDIPPVIVAPPAPVEPVVAAPAPAPTGNRSSPKLRSTDKPPYPAASIRASEQGTTKLELCVSAQGRVQSVSVAGTSGHARLDEAAAKWVRTARFAPGTIGGQAQSMCGYNIFYEWNLKDARS
ncbi:MAG: energy transducer TonB [Hyphomonadaceae bacterium]|nr:energy transducer TonB [Hyphomonadaceae bacterium]